MLKSFVNIKLAPWVRFLGNNLSTTSLFDSLESLALLFSPIDESLNMIACLRGIQNDFIKKFSEIYFNILIYWNLSCINYTHIHSLFDCVVKEHSVHRFSKIIQTSESETKIWESTANMATLTLLSKYLCSLNKVNSVIIVFRHTSRDGEDIHIENDILRWELNLLC